MNNRFQGDPAIQITPDGASMTFRSGQPVMDQGLENPVLMSLFTGRGYWGNVLESEESKKIGSDYEDACNQPITGLSMLNAITDAAKQALAWIDGDVAVTVANPRADTVKTSVTITPPGHDAQKLLFLKNGMNWIAQAQAPAHERLPEVS